VSARRKARKRALDVLFESDQRALAPVDVLEATQVRRQADGEPALNPYVAELVTGVAEHQEYIDELLNTYSRGWTVDRMPSVDRCILRIATFELLHQTDIPPGVVIAEAVALAADHSTDESPSFVNGLLARIAEIRERVGDGATAETDS
jgi:N utilization substance protein B